MTPSGEQLIMDADEDCIPEGAGLCGVCHGVGCYQAADQNPIKSRNWRGFLHLHTPQTEKPSVKAHQSPPNHSIRSTGARSWRAHPDITVSITVIWFSY